MNVGRVVGHLYCTIKDPNLVGHKILCVEPLNGREKPFFALDAVGAGAGEVVLYCRQREASYAFTRDCIDGQRTIESQLRFGVRYSDFQNHMTSALRRKFWIFWFSD